jgi:hypothetical protein
VSERQTTQEKLMSTIYTITDNHGIVKLPLEPGKLYQVVPCSDSDLRDHALVAYTHPRHVPEMFDELKKLIDACDDLKKMKDSAYSERNKLVALLASRYPASLERHPEEDKSWEDDWRWIVFIRFPTGQATWHIHDSELPLFDFLPRNQGRMWDGHSTEQKYERVKEHMLECVNLRRAIHEAAHLDRLPHEVDGR